MSANPPQVGTVVWAETEGAGKRVRVEVTSIEASGPNGFDVWGYRVGVRQRRAARQTSFPRRYFVPAQPAEVEQ